MRSSAQRDDIPCHQQQCPEHSHWAFTTQSCSPTSLHPRSHRALLPRQDWANRQKRVVSTSLSNKGRRSSAVTPDGPPAACSTPGHPEVLREKVMIQVQGWSFAHGEIVGEFLWHWRSLVRILKFSEGGVRQKITKLLQERALMTILQVGPKPLPLTSLNVITASPFVICESKLHTVLNTPDSGGASCKSRERSFR